jgi:hypothetical protein
MSARGDAYVGAKEFFEIVFYSKKLRSFTKKTEDWRPDGRH